MHPPPRKRFGQHFLHDPAVIRRIVDAVDPRPGDCLVEIGPGRGALTLPILHAAGRLHAVEIDRDVALHLAAHAGDHGELVLHQADALRFDFAALEPGSGPLRIVGNLPYNISTPLLFHLLSITVPVRDLHLMLQREVVERMAAAPGEHAYGRLSVMTQYRCRVERLFTIGPGAFRPAPKVDSAFVRLVPFPTPPVVVRDEAHLRALVTQAFSQRRKTLRNALHGLLSAEQIRALGVDPGTRPERLGLAEFARLSNACVQDPVDR
ncbi:MAG: 16S rRNA (adenine(1518)-N(6)/adenine(1519)-N(6))-dimethyltransferase [Chromatiales bacterium 21-64-14]|nr:MAG: 16S rRNA (adenine(1518)-N(6)/adenine(1519)-N(6))-dimethyltransferase [Chromatiales bacterium 21-64-14]HQU16579.1 16S rRNA (adenine(1518)-N(6)/adenine(1519)-N(6))-dimethyltransferase RsmA [Gammaproteobacteria bacterium]